MPRRLAFIDDPEQEGPDKRMQPLRRSRRGAQPERGGIFFQGRFGPRFQDRQIQPFLVAKVVIDRRDVRTRALANFTDGRCPKAARGKNFTGRLQQSLFCFLLGLHFQTFV